MQRTNRVRHLHSDQRGLEGVEYLLIAALVIVAAVAAWRLLGTRVSSDVKKVADASDKVVEESLRGGVTTGSGGNKSGGDVKGIEPDPAVRQAVDRARTALEKLIGMLPPDEQARVREWANRNLDRALADGDMERVRKVLHAVNLKAEGANLAQQAEAMYDAAWAEFGAEAASNVKTAADLAMKAAELYGTYTGNPAADKIAAVYSVITAYIEGGSYQAAQEALKNLNTASAVFISAMQGYEKDGLSGAAQEGAKAAFEAALKKIIAGRGAPGGGTGSSGGATGGGGASGGGGGSGK